MLREGVLNQKFKMVLNIRLFVESVIVMIQIGLNV